jgi:hypothetical protein
LYNVQTLVPCGAQKRPSVPYGRRGLAAEIIRPAGAHGLADTIRFLERHGFAAAFLLYPEVADLLGTLTKLLT